MMGLGTAVHTDTLSGLLRLVKDPASVEAHIAAIKKAEDDYKATVDKATTEVAAQRTALAQERDTQDSREAALSKRESEVSARETAANAAQAALDKEHSEFQAFEEATSAELSQKAVDLDFAMKAFDKAKADWTAQTGLREMALAQREFSVIQRETDLGNREKALRSGEAAHEKRSAALLAALGDPTHGVEAETR